MQWKKIGIHETATAAAVDKNNDVDVDVDAGIVAVDVVGMTNREKGLFLLRKRARKENDLGFTLEHLKIKQLCLIFNHYLKIMIGRVKSSSSYTICYFYD